jgi:D-ribose pyranase
MKRTRLLVSDLSHEVGRIRHTASVTLCDAGLPIPRAVRRIDLAVERGYPSLIRTLDVLLSEMMVEAGIVASEIQAKNPGVYREMMGVFRAHEMDLVVTEVPHD